MFKDRASRLQTLALLIAAAVFFGVCVLIDWLVL